MPSFDFSHMFAGDPAFWFSSTTLTGSSGAGSLEPRTLKQPGNLNPPRRQGDLQVFALSSCDHMACSP